MTFGSVDDLLAGARSRLERLTPGAAALAVERGARLVDIRPAWQRQRDGEIAGVPATDVDFGFRAWAAAGLPTVPGAPTAPDSIVAPASE